MSKQTINEPYFKGLNWSLLSIEEEHAFLKKACEGDTKARDKIIKENLPFIVYLARSVSSSGIEIEDMIQTGCEALINMFRTFNFEKFEKGKTKRFITYARIGIKQQMLDLRRQHLPIILQDYGYRKLLNIKNLMKDDGVINESEALDDVADKLKMKKKNVKQYYFSSKSISLENSTDYSEPNKGSLRDTLESNFSNPFEDAYLAIESESLSKAMEMLNETERKVISFSYGFEGEPINFQKIGTILGYTREGIRCIHNRAINKLKIIMEGETEDE